MSQYHPKLEQIDDLIEKISYTFPDTVTLLVNYMETRNSVLVNLKNIESAIDLYQEVLLEYEHISKSRIKQIINQPIFGDISKHSINCLLLYNLGMRFRWVIYDVGVATEHAINGKHFGEKYNLHSHEVFQEIIAFLNTLIKDEMIEIQRKKYYNSLENKKFTDPFGGPNMTAYEITPQLPINKVEIPKMYTILVKYGFLSKDPL